MAAAQNREKAAKRKMPEGRRFKKGQSGNPGGRPKGFAARIREATNDGEDLIQFAVAMVKGKTFGSSKKKPSDKVRLDAWKWLAERAYGRPVQAIELTGAEGGPLEVDAKQTTKTEVTLDASPERLAAVIDVLRESGLLAEGAPAGEAGSAGEGADPEDH